LERPSLFEQLNCFKKKVSDKEATADQLRKQLMVQEKEFLEKVEK